MRVLWTHNFDPAQLSSQVYMNTAARELDAHGVQLQLEYLGNLRSVTNLLKARRRARRLAADVDLVHAQYGSATGLATAAVERIPKVLSIRGNDWSVHRESIGFQYAHTRVARAMTRLSIDRYDYLLPVSARLAAEIGGAHPMARVAVLPSPVDLDRFVPLDKATARSALGIGDRREKWILFNALRPDDPIKRFSLAKAAFDLANARRGDLRLRVATGLRHDQIPLFVAACDLVLCTSETEGWPNSVKEALACNVPFVSTDVSDLALIARHERACRICPPDPSAIAEHICSVLDGLAPTDLRKHVVSMSVSVSAARLAAVYRSVIAHCGES